jgi:hypothetical protein
MQAPRAMQGQAGPTAETQRAARTHWLRRSDNKAGGCEKKEGEKKKFRFSFAFSTQTQQQPQCAPAASNSVLFLGTLVARL